MCCGASSVSYRGITCQLPTYLSTYAPTCLHHVVLHTFLQSIYLLPTGSQKAYRIFASTGLTAGAFISSGKGVKEPGGYPDIQLTVCMYACMVVD